MNLTEKPPVLILGRGETTSAIAHGNDRKAAFPQLPDTMDHWRVKSQWLCDLLDEREKTDGYQYNALFLKWFCKEFNVGPFDENGSILSLLIFNAQHYRRIDAALRAGWKPLTPALVQEALDKKVKVEVLGENMLGGKVEAAGYRPIKLNDGYFILAPRSRSRGFRADGTHAARLQSK